MTQPSFSTDTMLDYLDELRESGRTNMFGAGAYLQRQFPRLSCVQASTVVGYWMETFPRNEVEK